MIIVLMFIVCVSAFLFSIGSMIYAKLFAKRIARKALEKAVKQYMKEQHDVMQNVEYQNWIELNANIYKNTHGLNSN